MNQTKESREDEVQLESDEKPTWDIDVGAVGDETGKVAKGRLEAFEEGEDLIWQVKGIIKGS